MLRFARLRSIEGRVLVVEDNAESADVISECLARAGAEIVGPVPTPAAARQVLQHEQVDVVLFDATWGSENEVAQLAKDLEARRLPSLMLNGMPLSAASPLRDGRAEVLWPFSEAVLQEMVRELVLRTQQGLPYQH